MIDSYALSTHPETKKLASLSDTILIQIDRAKTNTKQLALADIIQLEYPEKDVGFIMNSSIRTSKVTWSLPSPWKNAHKEKHSGAAGVESESLRSV